MNENIKKIIELSDCEWIQARGQKWYGGYWIVSEQNLKSKEFSEPFMINNSTTWEVSPIESRDIYRIIWLPFGFNPESGNWQIDDLLMEAMGFVKPTICVLRDMFIEWLKGNDTTESTIILKLEWLHELIETENTK